LGALVMRSCLGNVDAAEVVHLDSTISIILSAVHLDDIDVSMSRQIFYCVECEDSEARRVVSVVSVVSVMDNCGGEEDFIDLYSREVPLFENERDDDGSSSQSTTEMLQLCLTDQREKRGRKN